MTDSKDVELDNNKSKQEQEAYWSNKILQAIHEAFATDKLDGHKHEYEPDIDMAQRGIIKQKCILCGFAEPVTTITRLID